MSMQFGSEASFSNMCGVTLMNTPVGRVVAEVMGRKEGVELTEYPSMIRVDGPKLLDFDSLRPDGPPRRQDDPLRQP